MDVYAIVISAERDDECREMRIVVNVSFGVDESDAFSTTGMPFVHRGFLGYRFNKQLIDILSWPRSSFKLIKALLDVESKQPAA